MIKEDKINSLVLVIVSLLGLILSGFGFLPPYWVGVLSLGLLVALGLTKFKRDFGLRDGGLVCGVLLSVLGFGSELEGWPFLVLTLSQIDYSRQLSKLFFPSLILMSSPLFISSIDTELVQGALFCGPLLSMFLLGRILKTNTKIFLESGVVLAYFIYFSSGLVPWEFVGAAFGLGLIYSMWSRRSHLVACVCLAAGLVYFGVELPLATLILAMTCLGLSGVFGAATVLIALAGSFSNLAFVVAGVLIFFIFLSIDRNSYEEDKVPMGLSFLLVVVASYTKNFPHVSSATLLGPLIVGLFGLLLFMFRYRLHYPFVKNIFRNEQEEPSLGSRAWGLEAGRYPFNYSKARFKNHRIFEGFSYLVSMGAIVLWYFLK